MIDIKQAFEAAQGEYLEFGRIENPPHPRADICGFLKLHELIPGDRDIVAGASHDEIYLDVGADELANVATQADIVYLHRCGIRLDDTDTGLAMFV